MRSLRQKLLIAFAATALPVVVAVGVSAEGEATPASFESVAGLYAAAELGLGGRPLYQRLFPSGWPTTKEFRKMTLDDGEGAFADSMGAFIASGLGVPVDVSTYERWRVTQRQQSEGGRAPGNVPQHLAQRWETFCKESHLENRPDLSPVFLPYRRGDPIPDKPFDETKLATWTWQTKGQDTAVTLDAVGLALYSYSLYAEQQLALEHKIEVGGTTNTYVGRTDVDGFLGLVALECAIAEVRELRDQLCLNAKGTDGKPILGPVPADYKAVKDRSETLNYFFPHGVAPTVGRATVKYEIGAAPVDSKMRLFDQAALMLGLCEIAKAASSKTGAGRFFGKDKKGASFDAAVADEAIDIAIFVANCIRYVSWNIASRGCPSSFSTSSAGAGQTLRVEDAGLLLLALEQFLSLNASKNDKLAAAQKEMAFVADRTTNFLLTVQTMSKPPHTGFCDTYDIAGQSAAESKNGEEKRSLFAQGMVVRGLLAAKRTSDLPSYTGPNIQKHPEAKDAAVAVLKWLEEKRWDRGRRAYVDEPGKTGTHSSALDSASMLGALRDMALDTGDARYLLRYKAYLGTLRASKFILAETTRAHSTDPTPGLLKTPAEAGKAPVVASEVTIP